MSLATRLPRLIAIAFAIGGSVHAISFLLIGAGIHLYGTHYPAWRHPVMATVDATIAMTGLRAPRWLLAALPAFVIEQLIVNGLYWEPVLVTGAVAVLAWEEWRGHQQRRGPERSREDAEQCTS